MTLYLEKTPGEFVHWNGEDIGGVKHPPSISTLWTKEELETVGLFEPVDAGVESNKKILSVSVQRLEGVVQYVYETEDKEVTVEDVIAERDSRLALGFDYDFGDERGVHRIGTTVEDKIGWSEVKDLADALIAVGDFETSIKIITNTGPVEVKALEWMNIILAASNFRQPVWQASFVLQTMSPIPQNFRDDSFWP